MIAIFKNIFRYYSTFLKKRAIFLIEAEEELWKKFHKKYLRRNVCFLNNIFVWSSLIAFKYRNKYMRQLMFKFRKYIAVGRSFRFGHSMCGDTSKKNFLQRRVFGNTDNGARWSNIQKNVENDHWYTIWRNWTSMG